MNLYSTAAECREEAASLLASADRIDGLTAACERQVRGRTGARAGRDHADNREARKYTRGLRAEAAELLAQAAELDRR